METTLVISKAKQWCVRYKIKVFDVKALTPLHSANMTHEENTLLFVETGQKKELLTFDNNT